MPVRRVALVTGANASIGLEVVRALARKGMTVYLGSRDAEQGETAAQTLQSDGTVRAVHIDTTDDGSMKAAIDRIAADEGHLDVLVNNAGTILESATASSADPDTIRRTLDANIHGPARLIQLALPLLRRSDAARVVNVSSGTASLDWLSEFNDAMPVKPYAYCLSKIAVNGMTLLFADELKPEGIKVNACSPGYVSSKLTRYRGTATPEQGAKIIVKLATLPENGPTGGFFNDHGALRW